jgi:TonB-linked SusC/RagA family outer membrane protein
MRKILLLLVGVLTMSLQLLAQTRNVSGTIQDNNGQLLPGVTVRAVGSNAAITTDSRGAFTLTVPQNATSLEISYVGFEPQTVAIPAQGQLAVTLVQGDKSLDEVVVVAYGTQRRGSITGAVSTIGAEQLEKRMVTNISQALAGSVPGISATSGSGAPGSSAAIRVRGFGSINHGAAPLYVVDGFPYDGFLADINPDDIENISVLKDASSTALYGARAANGVIMITTKRGKTAQPKVTLSLTRGYSQRGIPEYDMVGAYDYYPVMWRALKNSLMYPQIGTGLSEAAAAAQASATIGNELRYNPFSVPTASLVGADGKLNPNATLMYNDFDWFSPLINNGPRTEANLSTSAKVGRSDYYFSLNYVKDAGFLIETDFQRVSARVGVNTQHKDWLKSGLNVNGIFLNYNNPLSTSNNALGNAFNFARGIGPIYPVRAYDTLGRPVLDASGNHFYDYGQHPGAINRPTSANSGRHIVYETQLNENITKRNTVISRAYLEATFLQDFTFTANMGLDLNDHRTQEFRNKIVGDGVTTGGLAIRSSNEYRTITMNQLLNYRKNFRRHELGVLLGHESTKRDETYFSGSRRGMNLEGNVELINFVTINGISGSTEELNREGYFSRVMYNWDKKYFLELGYRRDASSRFSPQSRWGNFYSVGASWNIKRESFLDPITWINDLRFRAAYGTTGNDDVLDGDGNSVYYAYPAIYDLGSGNNNAQEPGAIALRLPTPDLTWEVNQSINLGLDFGLFKNRVSGSIELFHRGSKDLLFNVSQGYSGLVTTRNENIGAMYNRGIEVQLNGGIIRSRNFSWDIQLNATHLKNKITEMPNGETQISGTKRWEEGHDVYQFWLRQWYGVDPTDGAGLFYALPGISSGYRVTAKGDTVVTNPTSALFARSGSAIPKLFGGIGSTVEYKGFSFSFQLNYQLGGKYYDNNYASLMAPSYGGSLHADVLNSWKNPGDITDIPRLDITSSGFFNSASNRWLIDASYLSVRTVNLSYSLNRNLLSKLKMNQVRFSIIGENLAMFSKRKGLNPSEAFSGTNSNVYTPNRVLSAGVNVTF